MPDIARRGLALAALALLAGPLAADTVRLKSGARIEGDLVKRNAQRIWLDIGPDILSFSVEDVEEVITDEDDEHTIARADQTIFYTADELAERSPKEQAKRVGPAVIKVRTPAGLGSGVIINPDGYAITNAHVIQGESTIRVTVWFPENDGTLRRETIEDVEIVAVNNHLDLGLLKIALADDQGSFPIAPLEQEERIEIGQTVFAIGNPLGLERTLSQGVISTKQRSFDGISYIQTDAAINPGNSGGPLFNTKGEVVGITNMGILGGEALGFAIPARYVKDFIRNREAFAYDKTNPNSGHNYHQPPPRTRPGTAPALRDGTGQPDA
jgi:serine protease Do